MKQFPTAGEILISPSRSVAEIHIATNLNNLFQILRHPTQVRLLWTDAVYSDQSNSEERNHQVGLMDWIYRQAEKVIAWLGVDQGDAQDTFYLIRETTRFLNNQEMKHGSLDRVPHVDSEYLEKSGGLFSWFKVSRILNRSYFERACVVQEVGIATDCEIFCGSYTISRAELDKLASYIIAKGNILYRRFGITVSWRITWLAHASRRRIKQSDET